MGKAKGGERTVAGPGAFGVHVAGVDAAGVRYSVDGCEGGSALEFTRLVIDEVEEGKAHYIPLPAAWGGCY